MASTLEAQTPPPPLEQSRPHCGHCRDNGGTCLIFGGVRAIAGGTWRDPTAANLETAGNELARAAIRIQEAVLANPTEVRKDLVYAAEYTVDPTCPRMELANAGMCQQLGQAATLYQYFHELEPK